MKIIEDFKLTRIESKFLRPLQLKFKVNWPEHIMAYNTIELAVRRSEKSSEDADSVKIYTLNSWRDNGTFIASLVSSFDMLRDDKHLKCKKNVDNFFTVR